MKRNKLVEVEEDGEDIFIPMPKKCMLWKCNKAPIIIQKGFHVCSRCRVSYGK